MTAHEKAARKPRNILTPCRCFATFLSVFASMSVPNISVAQDQTPPRSMTWSGSGSIPPPGIPPATGAGRPRPDYFVEIDGTTSPDKFSIESLSAFLFQTITRMQSAPVEMTRSFLASEVGLSDSQIDAVLGAASALEGAPALDAAAERMRVCNALKATSDPSVAAAALEESMAREAARDESRAAARLALLDEETSAKVRAWVSQKVRPSAKRVVIDYQKFFAQPGAVEMMRARVCGAPQSR